MIRLESTQPVSYTHLDVYKRQQQIHEYIIHGIHYNKELYIFFRDVEIIKYIKRSMLMWAGHLLWMAEDEIPRKVLIMQLDGIRKRGRPKLQGIDDVSIEAQLFGLSNWRANASDWNCWRKRLEEAKTQQ